MENVNQEVVASWQSRGRYRGLIALTLFQLLLMVLLLVCATLIYLQIREANQRAATSDGDGVLEVSPPVTIDELDKTLDSRFTSIDKRFEVLVDGVEKNMEAELKKAFRSNADSARGHREMLFKQYAADEEKRRQGEQMGLAAEISQIQNGLGNVIRDHKAANAQLRSISDAAVHATDEFQANVEKTLAGFRKSISDMEEQISGYGQITESYREQIRRYGATSLRPQYTQLVFCHTEKSRMTTESRYKALGDMFDDQEVPHLLQYKDYVLETKIASGSFLQNWGTGLSEGQPIYLDRLVSKFFTESPGGDGYRKRLVFVAEIDSGFRPGPAFAAWCNLNKVEVSVVFVVPPNLSDVLNSAAGWLRKWSEFCQQTGGQMATVFVSQNSPLTQADQNSISSCVQRALHPVVGSKR